MQNNPLHIQPIQEGITNPLKYDFLTFVGLDAVDSILLEQRERSECICQLTQNTCFLRNTSTLPQLTFCALFACKSCTQPAAHAQGKHHGRSSPATSITAWIASFWGL